MNSKPFQTPLAKLYMPISSQPRCHICGATYDTSRQLARHKRDRHGPTRKCEHCDLTFPLSRLYYYKLHLKNKHTDILAGLTTTPTTTTSSITIATTSTITTTATTTATIATTTISTLGDFVSSSSSASIDCVTSACLSPSYDPRLNEYSIYIPSPDPLTFSLEEEFDSDSACPDPASPISSVTPPSPAPPSSVQAPALSSSVTPPLPCVSVASPVTAASAKDTEESYTPGSPANVPSYQPTPLEPSKTNSSHGVEVPMEREDAEVKMPHVLRHLERVSKRPLHDPRLLFKDAPSNFLQHSLAKMAQKMGQESKDGEVDVVFDCTGWSVVRKETGNLPEGQYTMTTQLTPVNLIVKSRPTQTKTEVLKGRCPGCSFKASGCGSLFLCK